MMYYIYKIENELNHKKYIGLTNNIKRRRTRHFTDLKRNCHCNRFLQKEYDIFGKEVFSFSIEYEGDVSDEEIGKLEREYIKKYDSYKNGYNQNEGGNFGASNGGTHFTQSDIFNILSALEFMTKPGQVLADIFETSRTTISRIKRGENHSQYKREYENLPFEERKEIFDIFNQSVDLDTKKANSSFIQARRKLTENQVHLILINREIGSPLTQKQMGAKVGVSAGTVKNVLTETHYKNFCISFRSLTDEQKTQLASLLSN